MAVIISEKPNKYLRGACASLNADQLEVYNYAAPLSTNLFRCDVIPLNRLNPMMRVNDKFTWTSYVKNITDDGQVVWAKPYVERCCDELKTFFDYIEVTLTEDQWNVIRDCLNGYQNKFYTVYKIKKKSGGFRTIEAPCDDLKYIQRLLLDRFATRLFKEHRRAYGFVKGRNIFSAAKSLSLASLIKGHAKDTKALVKIDLKDFFPSISTQFLSELIFKYFREYICRSSKGNWGFWKDLDEEAHIIDKLKRCRRVTRRQLLKKNVFKRGEYTYCPLHISDEVTSKALYRMTHLLMALIDIGTYNGRLPQGSPLSPFLSNIALERFDAYSQGIFKGSYLRYADDICIISETAETATRNRELVIRALYNKCPGVSINPKKVHIIRHGKPMRVVGYNINEDSGQPTIPRYKRKNFEAMLYNISTGKHALTQSAWKKINGYRALYNMSGAITSKMNTLYETIKKNNNL